MHIIVLSGHRRPRAHTLARIEPIYLGIRDNPAGLSRQMQIRACFIEHDVPDGAQLSDAEFAQMLDSPEYVPSTAQGKVCLADPNGTFGVTVDQVDG